MSWTIEFVGGPQNCQTTTWNGRPPDPMLVVVATHVTYMFPGDDPGYVPETHRYDRVAVDGLRATYLYHGRSSNAVAIGSARYDPCYHSAVDAAGRLWETARRVEPANADTPSLTELMADYEDGTVSSYGQEIEAIAERLSSPEARLYERWRGAARRSGISAHNPTMVGHYGGNAVVMAMALGYDADTGDQEANDSRPDACWRCDSTDAATDVGLCHPCHDNLTR